jgi:hypothetical protein
MGKNRKNREKEEVYDETRRIGNVRRPTLLLISPSTSNL